MLAALVVALRSLALICGGHRAVALENLALRQQLAVFKRTVRRPQLRHRDRLFWMLLANAWQDWRTALIVVHPDTVVRWHRPWLRRQWTRRSARGRSRAPEHDCDYSDTRDEDRRRESALGRSSYPRRVGQVGPCGLGANRLPACEAAASPAVADLANVPHESRPSIGLDGLLHRPDR